MGISTREFQVAMDAYGAKRLPDRVSWYGESLPCFNVAGTDFFPSGAYYICRSGKKVPEEIMNCAMVELGEMPPGESHFYRGEIYSLSGLLTLIAMLEGKYRKELVDELVNETYKKLLDCSTIKSNVDFPFHSRHSPKMERLDKLLDKYSNIVNPFANSEFKLKEPIQYWDAVELHVEQQEGRINSTGIDLYANSSCSKFKYTNGYWSYDTKVPYKNGKLAMQHFYLNGRDGCTPGEFVKYSYFPNKYPYGGMTDLSINLTTGNVCEDSCEFLPVTDEQIEFMIMHFKISIQKIKKEIVCKMINI